MIARFSSWSYLSFQPEMHVTRKEWMSCVVMGDVELRIRREDQGPAFRLGFFDKGGIL